MPPLNGRTVEFDREKLERLRQAKEQAEKDGLDRFTFDGDLFLVRYAHYLIEYLDGMLAR